MILRSCLPHDYLLGISARTRRRRDLADRMRFDSVAAGRCSLWMLVFARVIDSQSQEVRRKLPLDVLHLRSKWMMAIAFAPETLEIWQFAVITGTTRSTRRL